MQCVPFLDAWTGSESRLDLHAIYRRPGPGVNLTGGVPVRRHAQYSAKGFVYVSLASVKDVNEAAKSLREAGHNPTSFQAAYTSEGAFDTTQYIREATADDAARLADLRGKVEKYGADVVMEMMRVSDPSWTLPDELRELKPAHKSDAKADKAEGGKK